ncbi:hypothetical protein SEMRO_1814_G299300.1 [Seminavis robusta]|uniref:Uncharacterized protein n=1 Tax=Seminavis robusta TaxID=568900 RepID=A0A9N8HVI8_9STRA|nr:hypothetical protein SEMRO_1814_G299300.1 [Seminavis robusta]|eukprot:Sro1814_g299300.1 n/a (236) ;mRNA; f:2177-2884
MSPQALNQQRNNNQKTTTAQKTTGGAQPREAPPANKKKSPTNNKPARGGRPNEEGPVRPKRQPPKSQSRGRPRGAQAAGQDEEGEEELEEEATLPPEAHKIEQRRSRSSSPSRRAELQHQEKQVLQAIDKEIELTYGFVSDPDLHLHDNDKLDSFICRLVLLCQANQPCIPRPYTTIKPPPGLYSLLGLGHKFIPTPRYSHTWNDIEQTPSPGLQGPEGKSLLYWPHAGTTQTIQ